MKKVAILLATYNGGRWLDDQLDSLLAQQSVEVTIFVSDDMSTDNTVDRLNACGDTRLHQLPSETRFGSAASNFFRLLRDVDFTGFDAVSLSDQDDVWYPDKLQRALASMNEQQADAVSTNVLAFWPDGRERLLCKSQPQKRWDHHFEAAGPGCTYVLSQPLAESLQRMLRQSHDSMNGVALHDWFIYCYARSHGYRWFIDPAPSMAYRQHADNVIGANLGLAAARARYDKIKAGWYQEQILLIAKLCGRDQQQPVALLHELSPSNIFRLFANVRQMRRYWRDQIFLALSFVLFTFRSGKSS